MLDKIINKKIELLPRIPKENEKLCDTCGGTGWLYDNEKGYIERCPVCHGGVIPLCPICHQPIRGVCTNEECRDLREKESEQKRLDKAIRAKYEDVPEESKKMLYSESYGYNEGYFQDIDELAEYCEEHGTTSPGYVWSTTRIALSMDADKILEMVCEDLHEDARDNITDEDELQKFLNDWCEKQTGTDTYTVDYKYVIEVE